MKESNKKVKGVSAEVQEVVDIILAGTAEQAEEVLKGFRGYKPIPGVNMMTIPMIRRLARGGQAGAIRHTSHHCHIPHIKGKWESDIDGIVSISDYLKAADIDCEPSAGMKMVGCGPRNSRVNLYDPKGVLAILYASIHSRPRVEGKVRQVYGLETVEEVHAEVIPAPSVETVTISPEFAKFLRALADAIEGGVK